MAITNVNPLTPTYLFGRAYAVALAPPPVQGTLPVAAQYGNIPIIGKNISPLRVKFDIDKVGAGTSSKSVISIYNLSSESRQKLDKGWMIRLQAGYQQLVDTIFYGNISFEGTKSTRSGPDIITEIHCGDGESAITYARWDFTYPPGTTLAKVLRDVALAMNTDTQYNPGGLSAGSVIAIPNYVYTRGLVVHGECREILNTVCKPRGLKWQVTNGNLDILPIKGNDGQELITISSETGMIGVPSSNKVTTAFTSLLNPKIKPGSLVKLFSTETPSLNGFYNVTRTKYEGDSHDNKWQVSCECVPSNSSDVQELPASNGFDFNAAVLS